MSLSSSSSNSNAGRLVSSSMHFEDTNSQQVTLIPLEQDEVTLNSKREVSNNITNSAVSVEEANIYMLRKHLNRFFGFYL